MNKAAGGFGHFIDLRYCSRPVTAWNASCECVGAILPFCALNLMNIVLNEIEARVLGALVEKDITTPDYYPLSLNALVNACNQRNNRDPVMNLEEGAVRDALDRLHEHGLAGPAGGADSRVTKYEHRLQESFNFSRVRPLFCACCCYAGLRRQESCVGGQSACTALKIWMRCNPVCRN